ncbi:MAG: UDP-3-O-acyl-N-acetylglucosamine deacetylase [Patescibacteria group bacterium]
MNKQLQREITIAGPNYFGFASTLRIRPQSQSKEWLMQTPCGGVVPITPLIADSARRRMCLSSHNSKIEVFEHIGCLQFMGLKGVELEVKDGFPKGFPPYHGRAHELWEAIKPHCVDLPSTLPAYTPSQRASWYYPETRNGEYAYTRIEPNETGKLILKISVNYKGLGQRKRTFDLPNSQLLEEIFKARTQGYPLWLKKFSRTGSFLGIWKNHDRIHWPEGENDSSALDGFILHRAQDLLGTLSLLCKDGLLSATVTSNNSGHEADVMAVQEAYRTLRQIGGYKMAA